MLHFARPGTQLLAMLTHGPDDVSRVEHRAPHIPSQAGILRKPASTSNRPVVISRQFKFMPVRRCRNCRVPVDMPFIGRLQLCYLDEPSGADPDKLAGVQFSHQASSPSASACLGFIRTAPSIAQALGSPPCASGVGDSDCPQLTACFSQRP